MPAADKSHTTLKINRSATSSLRGSTFQPANEQELHDAVDVAFDYRGDVTITLKDGTQLTCFVANRMPHKKKLTYFVKGQDAPQDLDYDAIAAIALTGEDPADGKSWEAWMSKKAEERAREAEKLRQEAIARGEL
jgi:transcriptional antiterminator Rof (Rho-off)